MAFDAVNHLRNWTKELLGEGLAGEDQSFSFGETSAMMKLQSTEHIVQVSVLNDGPSLEISVHHFQSGKSEQLASGHYPSESEFKLKLKGLRAWLRSNFRGAA